MARRTLLVAALGFAAGPAGAARSKARHEAAGPAYAGRAELRTFAADVASRRGLSEKWITTQLGKARRVDPVRQLVMPPPVGVAKNWAAYRERFVEPRRIAEGLAFWRGHERWLRQAEARWGVPPEIVVAVIGVETFYGRVPGNFRLVDALATLAFDFPSGRSDRSAFFRSELEELLVLCARERRDPQTLKGSYAGAMGLPQFMPSSVNRWALDFDGDGHVDLLGTGADAIGSVAHYFASFGWQSGLPAFYEVTPPADAAQRAVLLAPDIVPSFTAAQFAEHGAQLDEAGRAHEGLLALVELHNGDQPPSHVAGTKNFYVVTRYNWSSYYAMAVLTLAQALHSAMKPGGS
jgi:membrane-bound lytic murein transglycosylase B